MIAVNAYVFPYFLYKHILVLKNVYNWILSQTRQVSKKTSSKG